MIIKSYWLNVIININTFSLHIIRCSELVVVWWKGNFFQDVYLNVYMLPSNWPRRLECAMRACMRHA